MAIGQASCSELSGPLLSWRDIELLTTYSRTEIYRRIRRGEFPQPIKLGPSKRSKAAFLRSEVEAWLASRPRALKLAPN